MLRSEIIGEVRRAMSEVMEEMTERYVTEKELSQTFSFFTPSWLKHYSHLLPRERVCVVRPDGKKNETHWGYRLHKIQSMLAAGAFRELQYRPRDGRTSRDAISA